MKKKNKEHYKTRLPMEAVEKLKRGGGAHGSRKGKKGYDRKRDKKSHNDDQSTKDWSFFEL